MHLALPDNIYAMVNEFYDLIEHEEGWRGGTAPMSPRWGQPIHLAFMVALAGELQHYRLLPQIEPHQ